MLELGNRPQRKWSSERLNEPPKAAQVAGDRARISSQAGVHSRPKEVEAGPAMGSPTVVPVQYEFPEQSDGNAEHGRAESERTPTGEPKQGRWP